MYILGIGTGFVHDASVTLLKDGELIAAVEEERFDRVKHGIGYPKRAIDYCLKEGGITLKEIDEVAFNFKPGKKYFEDVWMNIKAFFHRKESMKYSAFLGAWAIYPLLFNLKEAEKIRMASDGKLKVKYIDHHLCHAASAFYVSPFEKAAILTIDNQGEGNSTTYNIGIGNEIKRIGEVKLPHSLGKIYLSVTLYLGFSPGDEYKVMGLSSFGEPEYYDIFADIIKKEPNGKFSIDYSYFNYVPEGIFSEKFYKKLGPTRKKSEPVETRHKNIACSMQRRLDDIGLHMAEYLYEKTKLDNLCLAGGVALNSVMNGKIEQDGPFKKIYVQPAASDIGTSLGAAYYIYHGIYNKPRKFVMDTAYWGPGYSEEEIKKAIDIAKLSCEHFDNIEEITAKLIHKGYIVGWFQGRLEWGPRALGSRSILADPTRDDMKDKVNAWVKHREDFRPFAPAVTAENASEYFKMDVDSPFMIKVYDVHDNKKSVVPAITHVDGTARPQTVTEKQNPMYYNMIREFEKLSGVPVVLNTSFNIMGEPIVNTPAQAIRCYSGTGIDALVMGHYLLKKPGVEL